MSARGFIRHSDSQMVTSPWVIRLAVRALPFVSNLDLMILFAVV